MATVEVFDEAKGGWRQSPEMAHERAFPCAVSMGSFFYVIAGSNRTNEVEEVEEWSHASSKWRRVTRHKAQADAGEFQAAKEKIDHCTDEIYLLEKDCEMEEAARLRRTVLPLLETRYKQAGVGKLSIWKGGSPRDSMLGMRHLSAQTILPGSTVDMLLQRLRAADEAAKVKEVEEENHQKDALSKRIPSAV